MTRNVNRRITSSIKQLRKQKKNRPPITLYKIGVSSLMSVKAYYGDRESYSESEMRIFFIWNSRENITERITLQMVN